MDKQLVRPTFRHRLLKVGGVAWVVIGAWDTLAAQFLPPEWAAKAPTIYKTFHALSGYLPLWAWLVGGLVLALALVADLSVRQARYISALPAAADAPDDTQFSTDSGFPLSLSIPAANVTDRELRPGGVISRIDPVTGDDRLVRIEGDNKTPYVWLRIEPNQRGTPLEPVHLLEKLRRDQRVVPLGDLRSRSVTYNRNDQGAVAWVSGDDSSIATNIIQIDRYGEIVGVDTEFLDGSRCSVPFEGKIYKLIYTDRLKDIFHEAISSYGRFLMDVVKIPFPLRVTLGVCRVDDYRLHGDRTARIAQDSIYDSFVINDLNVPSDMIWRSFRTKIYEAAGRSRTE